MEIKKSGRGGARAGAGRPKGSTGEIQRTQHQVRATDEEWEVIKALARLVKKDLEVCKNFIQDINK